MENMEVIENLLKKENLFQNAFEHLEAVKLAIELLEAEDLQRSFNDIVFKSASETLNVEDKPLFISIKNLIKINFLKIDQYTKELWINKCSMDWGK